MNRIYRSVWNEVTRTFIAAAEKVRGHGKPASTCRSALPGEVASDFTGRALAPMADQPRRRRFAVGSGFRPLALEQRFMFDGAAAVDATHAADAAIASAPAPVEVRAAEPAKDNGKKEVAFIDTSVANYKALEAGVKDGVAIVEIDGRQDGLAQIAKWAETHAGFDAIHIFSHGSEATLHLGNNIVTETTLSSVVAQAELAQIGKALTADGDILLYGCDVAKGADGQQFIANLATATGADVVASSDATGATAKGGDWVLEVSSGNQDQKSISNPHPVGSVETLIALNEAVQGSYETLLALPAATQNFVAPNYWSNNTGGSTVDGFALTESTGAVLGTDPSFYPDFYFDTAVLTDGFGKYYYELTWTADNTDLGTFDLDSFTIKNYAAGLGGCDFKLDFTGSNGETQSYTSSSFTASPSTDIIDIDQTKFNDISSFKLRVTLIDATSQGNAATMTNLALKQMVLADLKAPAPAAPSTPDLAAASDSGSSSTDNITSITTPVFNGTAEANATVTLYDSDGTTVLGTTTANGAGTWLITSSTLSAGIHTLTAKATNVAGNTSAASSNLSVTIDTSTAAPSAPDLAAGSDSGTSPSDNITSVTTPMFTGTAEANATVKLYDTDGTTLLGTTTATGGTWSITSSDLSAGSHTLTAKATDVAGNTSAASSGLTISVDNVLPILTINNGSALSYRENAAATVLDSAATLVETGSPGSSVVTVAITANNEAADILSITTTSGSGIWLDINGNKLMSGATQIGTTNAASASNGTLWTLSFAATATATNVQDTLRAIRYVNSSNDPGTANRTVTFNITDGAGNVATATRTVAITPVNNAPTLSAIGDTPSYIENGVAIDLFSAVSISTVESGQNISQITLTVGNLADGTNEILHADGTDIVLTNSTSGTTATNGMGYSVSVSGGTATVTLIKGSGISAAAATTLVDGLSYRNASEAPGTTNSRMVTLTGLTDTGGTASGGVDSAGLSIARSVTVVAVNDAPVLNAAASPVLADISANSGAPVGAVGSLVSSLVDIGGSLGNVTDVDAGAVAGIAVTAADEANGAWYYSTNGGTSWTVISPVSPASTLLLAADANTRLYFQPNPSWDGSATITFRAWDQSSGSAGSKADTITNGGTTAFSTATDTAQVTVRALSVSTINRVGPALTNATSAQYTVTFSEAVSGVDTSDFTLVATGGASGSITSVTGSGTTYTVTVGSLSGDGTLRLDLNSSGTGIKNGSNLDITSGFTSGQIYTLDHTNPAAPAIPVLAAASDSGSSNSDGITNVTSPVFTGTAEANATVKLYDTDGTTLLGTTTANGAGNWSISSSTLGAGAHTLTVKATDVAGNTGAASSGLAITIDTSAPTASVTTATIATGSAVTTNQSTETGVVYLVKSTVTPTDYASLETAVAGNNAAKATVSAANSNTSIDTAGLALGTYYIYAVDAAGNISAASGNAITLAQAPSITVSTVAFSADTGSSSTDFITKTAAQTISGTLSGNTIAGESVEVSLDNGSTWTTASNTVGQNTWSLAGQTLTGSNTMRVRVANAVGGGAALSQAYVLDTTAPTTTVTTKAFSADTGASASDFITQTAAQTVSGTLSGNVASGETVEVSLDNGSTWATATTTVGQNTWSLAGQTLTGNNTLQVRVSDDAGNHGTAITQAYVLDQATPTVSDARISISGASGTGGAFKIGDTVTATWNNTASGDNNSDIAGVTVDFSAFGGGAAIAATNSGGTWSATYTIVAGAIDGINKNVNVTVTDNAGNITPQSDSSNATLDNVTPTVTDGNISIISSGSGAGGKYVVGDTITVRWQDTGGDANNDTIAGVTVNFSAFGGGTAVVATNVGGVWTASYTITAASIEGANLNAAVTATDNAGNSKTTADSSNLTLDLPPTVTDARISINSGSGSGGAFKAGDTVTATWNNTAGGDNNSDVASVTFDFSAFGGGTAIAATNSGGIWTATYTIVVGVTDGNNKNVSVRVTDNTGNATTRADTSNAKIENNNPVQPVVVEPPPPPPPPIPIQPPPSVFVPPPAPAPTSFLPPSSPLGVLTADAILTQPGVAPPPILPRSFAPEPLTGRAGESGGFPVTVIRSQRPGQDSLVVLQGMRDQVISSSGQVSQFTLPADAFASTRTGAVVQLQARQGDGRPLPGWVKFDAQTGTFRVQAPAGVSQDMVIRVVARDAAGHEAVTTFKIQVGERGQRLPGRLGLSEQIRQANRPHAALDRLAAPLRRSA